MWSILENVPCALEKNVYSSAFGRKVLKISKSRLMYHLRLVFPTKEITKFCFDDLSIGVSGVLKSPTIIVLQSVSPSMSIRKPL